MLGAFLFIEEEPESGISPETRRVVNDDGVKIRTLASYVKDALRVKHTSHEYQ